MLGCRDIVGTALIHCAHACILGYDWKPLRDKYKNALDKYGTGHYVRLCGWFDNFNYPKE
jgi:hypothetical protein